MNQSKVITAVLVMLVILLSFKAWFDNDGDDRAAKRKYEAINAKQDSIINANNLVIESLNLRLDSLDSQRDSLIQASNKIDTKIIYINNKRNEAHNSIDTTGVSDIYKYWAIELERYHTDLRRSRGAIEDEDQ